MSAEPEKSKIYVDEDWKAQVQAEKEAAKAGPASPTAAPVATSTDPLAPGSTGGSAASSEPDVADTPDVDALPDMDLPPASLVFLCTTLATQAMIALGQVPNPITGKVELRLKQAKHYIDTLGMLEEKTTCNRTADETALFDDLLHQLRMAYVALQSAPMDSSN
jgi:hypothetical protein